MAGIYRDDNRIDAFRGISSAVDPGRTNDQGSCRRRQLTRLLGGAYDRSPRPRPLAWWRPARRRARPLWGLKKCKSYPPMLSLRSNDGLRESVAGFHRNRPAAGKDKPTLSTGILRRVRNADGVGL